MPGDERQSAAASGLDFGSRDVAQVVGALSLVIGLLFIARFVLTRASGVAAAGGRPSGVVEILARYPVARGQQLILLKLARRILVLHQNGTAMTTLSEIVDESEVASLLSRIEAGSTKKDSAGFQAIFRKFASEHENASATSRPTPEQGEVIDLTRRPTTLRNLFTSRGVSR